MKNRTKNGRMPGTIVLTALAGCAVIAIGANAATVGVLTGQAAFTDYLHQKPGTMRKITAADLPKPDATSSSDNSPKLVPSPGGAMPQAPAGFKVELFADSLRHPRLIRAAPNGDLFVAESEPGNGQAGRVKVLRGIGADGKAKRWNCSPET